MSDQEILDRAFDSFARDLAHAPSPGATAAVATARRRRRTRVGAVALVAVAVAGGGVVAPELPSDRDPAPVAAHPSELTAERFSAATEGWPDTWRSVGRKDFDAVEASMGSMTQECAERLTAALGSGGAPPEGLGDRMFRAGDATAMAIFLDFADAADASTYVSTFDRPPAACGAAVSGSVAATRTTYVPSTEAEDVWVAHDDDKVAVLLTLGLDSSPPAEVIPSVTDALVEALHADESFRHSDGMTSTGPDESTSKGITSVSGPAVTLGQIRASASGWPAELTDDARGGDVRLPCVSRSATAESHWSTAQQVGDRGTLTMAGEQEATYALDSLENALASCGPTRWTTRREGGGLWATSENGTVVMVAVGTKMAWLEVADVSPPSAEQAAGVQAVLRTWISDTVVTTETTAEP